MCGGGRAAHGTYRQATGMDHPASTPRPSTSPVRAGALASSDDVLVAAVRAGDDAAFELLYTRHAPSVVAQALGMLHDAGRAEDVTQEVFLSALRRMRETDAPIAFGAWVREIARNACIDHFRRARRRPELSYDAQDALGQADRGRLVDARPAPDAAVAQKQAIGDLQGAFDELSDAHHRILVLRELEGLSYREIGDRLGLGRAAVESTLFRARRRLAEEYEELSTGAKCLRVRGIIATAAQGPIAHRDERRLARHLARCAGCRREAWAAGVATPPRPARRALGALLPLPLPAFLRRLVAGHADRGARATQAAGQLGARLDPEVGSWAKVAAAAAAMVLTGVGAGEVVRHAGGAASAVAAPSRALGAGVRAAAPAVRAGSAVPQASAPSGRRTGASRVLAAHRRRPRGSVAPAVGPASPGSGGRAARRATARRAPRRRNPPGPAAHVGPGPGAVDLRLPVRHTAVCVEPAPVAGRAHGRRRGGGRWGRAARRERCDAAGAARGGCGARAGQARRERGGGARRARRGRGRGAGQARVVNGVVAPVRPVVDGVVDPVRSAVKAGAEPAAQVVGTATGVVAPVVKAATRQAEPVAQTVTAARSRRHRRRVAKVAAPAVKTVTTAPATVARVAAPVTDTVTTAPATVAKVAAPAVKTVTTAPATVARVAAPVTDTVTTAPATVARVAAPAVKTAPVTVAKVAAPVTETVTTAPATVAKVAQPIAKTVADSVTPAPVAPPAPQAAAPVTPPAPQAAPVPAAVAHVAQPAQDAVGSLLGGR